MSMMSELPVDLIEDILSRVPATSLARLRSTCKLWNYLFQDKRFASKHLDKAPKQGMFLMLKGFRFSMSVNLHGDEPSVELKGELSLMDPLSSSSQFEIHRVLHCEGLLLCTNKDTTRIVVWNPCTGQTRWIQPRDSNRICKCYYTLGSYKDNKSHNYSYKILCYTYSAYERVFEIYDMNSNSWRILDVIPDCYSFYCSLRKSLKGETYWFAWDGKYLFLVRFDYTTERFKRLDLPVQCPLYRSSFLSDVREEKLFVLLQPHDTSISEIWVVNKIGETDAVSWSKVLALDLTPAFDTVLGVSFLVDEENKVVVGCDKYGKNGKKVAYIVGEDNNIRQMDYGVGSYQSFLINYVPSLTQIQQTLGCKRSRA